MASQTTQHDTGSSNPFAGILRSISGFFASVCSAVLLSSAYTRRVHDFQALQAKSDAELAALGLKRDDIVHHVFQDLYYT